MKTLCLMALLALLGGCGSRYDEMRTRCMNEGFPEMKKTGQIGSWRYFCVRQVNGSDEVKEIR